MKKLFLLLIALTPATTFSQPIFINEIHYDNAGTDEGEAIEIAGQAGADLAGWSVVFYNGNGGGEYGTVLIDALTIPDVCAGFGVVHMPYPGIQNGSPDGIALVAPDANVVQFISYEGVFTAVGGPADGMTSLDIGVMQDSSTPLGASLQLVGEGVTYDQFSWIATDVNSFGECNPGQIFTSGILGYLRQDGALDHSTGITLNEVSATPGGDFNADGVADNGDQFIEIVNSSEVAIDVNGWQLATSSAMHTLAGLEPIDPTRALVVFTGSADVSNFDPGAANQVTAAPGLSLDVADEIVGLKNLHHAYVAVVWGDPGDLPPEFLTAAVPAGSLVLLDQGWTAGRSQTRVPDYTGLWDFHAALEGTCNWSASGDAAFDMPCPSASPARNGADGTVLATEVGEQPTGPTLDPAWPNPFNPATTLGYSLPTASHVVLTVHDLTGRSVTTLENAFRAAGRHEVRFDAAGLATGVYLVRMRAGGFARTRPVVLLR